MAQVGRCFGEISLFGVFDEEGEVVFLQGPVGGGRVGVEAVFE